jgi:hydrogenase maturation protease
VNEWEWSLLEDEAHIDHIEVNGFTLKPGSRVRLNPKQGGDILDLALGGQLAIIESIEEDYEGGRHVCVVLEDDPGRDLGMMRQPGHRFFFNTSEIEPVVEDGQERAVEVVRSVRHKILVAGIGNIFLGDDGFGVEVVRRLQGRLLPPEVRLVDFGIRGLDLVYALQDGYEATILIDAFPHKQAPGTVSIVEPNTNEFNAAEGTIVESHSMHPLNVLRMAGAMGAPLKQILLVGCEPAFLGGEEGHMGLSVPVQAAVEEAVTATEGLVERILNAQKVKVEKEV